ncbi:MAG: hypothetical protein WD939_04695, partial [Dehalococcoidia bacterium]
MTTDTHLEIDPSLVGELELETGPVPYVNLEAQPVMHNQLRVGATEYTYERSFPIKGHSAVLPAVVAELEAQG